MSERKKQQDVARNFDFHGPALDNIFNDYAELRAKCPVGRSEKYGGFWFVTKSEDIFAAEQDPETFSVAPSMLLPAFGTDEPLIPIDIDPPKHQEYRRILLPLFTPQVLKKLEDPIRQTARDLAKAFVEKGSGADASYMFARPLPTIIFSRLAGYPEKDWPKFDAWVDDIIYHRVEDPERSRQAANEVIAYFDNLLASWKDEGESNTLIDYILRADIDGRRLNQAELRSYCYLLFVAGLDTTAWAIRSGLWFLARNLEDQRKLRARPELVPYACEEFLRTLSPVQAMARTCLKDTVIRDQEIKKGDRVALVFGAGNRDEEVYPNPDKVDVERVENRHLAFGAGIHRCLGSNLGRRELLIAIEEFLNIVPEFKAADVSQQWHGVSSLNLEF